MSTKTNWAKVVSGEELEKVKTRRSKHFDEKKERRIALPELQEEGWIEYKNYSDNKFIGVRREKNFDEIFEDKVWTLFARLGFSNMNCDRYFEMSYDFNNPNFTKQIDVFAADDETVLIVECKSAEKMKDGVFKTQIEAFHGIMKGLMAEAKKKFPKAKVKFIWATHNYILSRADQDKLQEWGIVHFNDQIIGYYYDLVKHLGKCAKYQLLGNLFANTEIPNMNDKVPAIQGKMGNHQYYSFSIEPERLLKIGYVLHRNEANKNMMPTYQRLIKKKRLQSVQSFINDGGYFPNSLIISIETEGKGVQFDLSPTKVDDSISRLGVLHLPKKYRSAYIIDGQHRLYGYSDSKYAKTNCIPVVAFIDLDRQEQIKLFMDINENQKAVPKTLRVTLNADMLWDSNDYNEQRKALRSKIAQMFGEEATSPLIGRVVIGEDEKSPQKSITVEAVQLALQRCDFLSSFGKKNIVLKYGTFDLGDNQNSCDILYPFLEEILKYIKCHADEEWNRTDKEDGIITINRGIQAVIRVINDIVNYLVGTNEINPRTQKTSFIVEKVAFYLDPLINYFNSLTQQQRKDLRGYFGGGADTRFWRAFQREISEVRKDFKPSGLVEYWESEAKTFNADSMSYLKEIELKVKAIIREKLEQLYGRNWIIKGIPKNIYTRVQSAANEKNYENISNDDTSDLASEWDFVTLRDCKIISTSGTHWIDLYESVLTRPEEKNISGGKEAKTEWLSKLDVIYNKLKMPTASYSVSSEEYILISSIWTWLINK